jgi:hypothetical protein
MENDQVLTSWKEIAVHFGKGVRTVQRWEEQLGLPVRRREGSGTGIVLALRGELDEWLRSKMQIRPQQMKDVDSQELQRLISGLQDKIQHLIFSNLFACNTAFGFNSCRLHHMYYVAYFHQLTATYSGLTARYI